MAQEPYFPYVVLNSIKTEISQILFKFDLAINNLENVLTKNKSYCDIGFIANIFLVISIYFTSLHLRGC